MFNVRKSVFMLSNVFKRQYSFRKTNNSEILNNKLIDISDEVKECLTRNGPCVALESTIITHGMPFPANLECAHAVENIIREQGAIPATIAIIKGRIKVGASDSELQYLADVNTNKSLKVSRRDFPYVISNFLNGGTTVAGTIIVAARVGIPVFVTGGVGGVHRNAENTFDISADLTELGRNNIAVISSGVKSILDIPKTLEYLETQGVGVAVINENKEFPSFYSRNSGCQVSYNITTPRQAAELIYNSQLLNLQSGMMFAVPIPKEHALDSILLENVIQESLAIAKERNIKGKDVTPFLLKQIVGITKGKSLDSNIALIKHNAKIGAQIALELSKLTNLTTLDSKDQESDSRKSELGKPVIIGGAVVDCAAKVREESVQLDSSTHRATMTISGGGVGRNICEALSKLGVNPTLISVVGKDPHAEFLKKITSEKCFKGVLKTDKYNTAQYVVLCDANGECKLGLGDMDIFQLITPEVIRSNEDLIRTSPLLILDANLNKETILEAMKLATKHNVPVFYEPTDARKAGKIFEIGCEYGINFMSPNIMELRNIAKILNINYEESTKNNLIMELAKLGQLITTKISTTIIVTLGSKGVLIVSKRKADEAYFKNFKFLKTKEQDQVFVRLYPTIELNDIINVNGAGDCWSSGFITAMLAGLSEEKCVAVAFKASNRALYSKSSVPDQLFQLKDVDLSLKSSYTTLL